MNILKQLIIYILLALVIVLALPFVILTHVSGMVAVVFEFISVSFHACRIFIFKIIVKPLMIKLYRIKGGEQ